MSLQKSELQTIIEELQEEKELPGSSDEKKEQIDVMQIEFNDDEEEPLILPDYKKQIQSRLVNVSPQQKSVQNAGDKQIEIINVSKDQTSWRLVEASGLTSGILTTFTSHYYGYQLLLPISCYSGGVAVLAALVFGALNVRTSRTFKNFGSGLLNGLNFAMNHLTFFLLPVSVYGAFKWYTKSDTL